MLTWQAFGAGKIDAHRVALIASAVDKLRGDNHADHRARPPRRRPTHAIHTAAQLKGWLKRFVARNAPDQAAVKTENAKRSVWVDHQDDGMSFLHAYMPDSGRRFAIDAELTDTGQEPPCRRSDAWIRSGPTCSSPRCAAAVDGQSTHLAARSSGSPSPSPPSPASTDDTWCVVRRSRSPCPADMVRDLAANSPAPCSTGSSPIRLAASSTSPSSAGSHPTSSEPRSTSETAPAASPPAPDPPWSRTRTTKSPHPRGPTNGANLRGLCRRHHRMKTYRITEPTDHVMRDHAPSKAEHDLAQFLVNIEHAA